MKSFGPSLIVLFSLMAFAPAAAKEPASTWDRVINEPGRFKVLEDFDNEAVLDRETGLVWERTAGRVARQGWVRAVTHCYFKSVGGRKGWRLPTIEELSSLLDPIQLDPALPPGHPFDFVQTHTNYWSMTTHQGDTRMEPVLPRRRPARTW